MLSDAGAAAAVRTLTGGLGAEAVFDFVGAEPTVRTAAAVAAVESDVTIVGIGGAALPVGFGSLPFEVSVTAPYWGSRSELIEVLGLARSGAVSVHTETYSLDEAPLAYERLHAGKINGRAVALPNVTHDPPCTAPRTRAGCPPHGGARECMHDPTPACR